MRTTLARWIMDRATRNPPAGRESWAQAMAGEFAALQHDQLSWALGCWSVAAGWRLRAEWAYLLALFLAPLPIQLGSIVAFNALLKHPSHDAFMTWLAYQVLGPPMLVSFALAAYRPQFKNGTALGVALIPLLAMDVESWVTEHVSPMVWWFSPKSTLFMAPPMVGLCAILGVCYFGAAMGARFAPGREAEPRQWPRRRR